MFSGGIKRRQFLRLMGWSSVAFAAGCGPEIPDLVPYVRPPESIVAGKPTWFATTCRECPAGCGIVAKNVDGRIIKLEGNPLHPINEGKLCPRGQAALTGLYHPDRIPQPRKRDQKGNLQTIEWEEAVISLKTTLKQASEKKDGKILFMTPLITGTLKELIQQWLSDMGSGPESHVMYEPLAYESLKSANAAVFGKSALPTYRMDEADFLISFNADFLETWLSTVEYTRRFARFHEAANEKKGFFVHVGPRRSLTAANADHVIFVAPGNEYLAAVGILKAYLEIREPNHLSVEQVKLIKAALGDHTVKSAAEKSGAAETELRLVAKRISEAHRPLSIAGGNGSTSPNADFTALSANLLCLLKEETGDLIDFQQSYSIEEAASRDIVKRWIDRMQRKEIDLLLIHDTNPAFSLPGAWEFSEAVRQVPQVVSFSGFPDETSRYANLHLPAHSFLETWGDYQPKRGVTGLLQPAMGPVFNSKSLADILIAAWFHGQGGPPPEFLEVLQASWRRNWKQDEREKSFKRFWVERLQAGGRWSRSPRKASAAAMVDEPDLLAFPEAARQRERTTFHCVVYPTIQFYDGKMANSPWIQELPDPVTQVTWGGWVEVHPEDAIALDVEEADLVSIESPYGAIHAPVMPIPSVPKGTVAVPIGQGHTHYGRFANALPDNPYRLLPPHLGKNDRTSADALTVRIGKLQQRFGLAKTSGSLTEQGRPILQTENFDHYKQKAAAGHKPDITPPLPSGYLPERDFYPPHDHVNYRWSMIVDLDRCIGCGACVVACYAENNVAFVGREQMLKMREMSWIRVQRYFHENTDRMGWLVMLCQHCDSAPCESVCPIFAPQHSKEGLNNQVYNRCFGTRFCSQNDPYKVRRFNWFTWTRPDPLDMQLNPDVTVRQKGIMEKCSFCVQRIVAAKIEARLQGRLVRDGEFTTACAQTCPTDALIFGSLLDPNSRVSKYIADARAYQVFHHLNTKPAVIYLKKLTQKL